MAMGITAPVLQIVGYQNSGKTTFMTKLIEKLTKHGNKVGCIKHHGHGGKPYIADEGKDSGSFRMGGAVTTCVEGDGRIIITSDKDESWTLKELLHIYSRLSHDIILVEGYKKENYPKIVCIRSAEDVSLLTEVENIVMILTKDPFFTHTSYPVYAWGEEEEGLDWLVNYIGGIKRDR